MTINATNALGTEMTTIMTRIQANMLAPAMSVHMQKGEPMDDYLRISGNGKVNDGKIQSMG